MPRLLAWISATIVIGSLTGGCASAYYAAWEKLGKEKRDLLRDRVRDARDEQRAATEQFADALTRLEAAYGFDGGDLEEVYRKVERDYGRCAERASAVRDRIEKVETIAADLFAEWDEEAGQIQDNELRRRSRSRLTATRARYDQMRAAMRRAEASMEPVLVRFRDQVLYLKHNLNAAAVGALGEEMGSIEAEVERLTRDMKAAIAEAESFLAELPD